MIQKRIESDHSLIAQLNVDTKKKKKIGESNGDEFQLGNPSSPTRDQTHPKKVYHIW